MNSGSQRSKNKEFKESTPSKEANKSKEQKKKAGKESGSVRKQRVFINRGGTTNTPTCNIKLLQQQPQMSQMTPQQQSNYFGPQIPSDVMENILFRFLYNIPENEKNDQIRVCFHIELAHWFYLDIYCPDNAEPPAENCKKVGFHQFVRQVFYKCDYLDKWRTSIDMIIDAFRQYKSSVPTYGVIMLDPTLNYVLLVQGYYASTNSWGFPKGKINEGELPVECAVREAFEEVGFDSKEYLLDKVRPLQSFVGETLVRLYIATDVPMDFHFKPHLRKEIRKISWFSVWDLPKSRNDDTGLSQLGLYSNNFYSVLPFINGICEFISRERAELKPKCSILKHEGKSESSAFQPVIPKASSDQKLSVISPNPSSQNLHQTASQPSTSKQFDLNNLFKPLKIEPDNPPPPTPSSAQQSFTGQTFLEQFMKGGGAGQEISNFLGIVTDNPQVPRNPAGVIGAESRNRHKEIKQPKPLHPSNLMLNVYEAPPEQFTPQQEQQNLIPSLFSHSESPQKKFLSTTSTLLSMETPKKGKTFRNDKPMPLKMVDTSKSIMKDDIPTPTSTTIAGSETSGNEIVNMLRSSIGKKETKKVITSELVPMQFDQSLHQKLGELKCRQKV
uniref:mRNA-decapping enzyme 2 n=1 Tax=Meloidogyne javanica TaxID=6303 RepID=A0A915LZ83_MELJA